MKVPTTDELMAARPGLLKDAGKFDTTMRGFSDLEETASGDLIDEEPEEEAEEAGNAASPSSPPWLAALSADLKPLGDALLAAAQAGDHAAVKAAARKISSQLPDFLDAPELAAALEDGFLADLTQED